MQQIVLGHKEQKLAMAMNEVIVQQHYWLLLFAELANTLVTDVLEAHNTLKVQCVCSFKRICFILFSLVSKYLAMTIHHEMRTLP